MYATAADMLERYTATELAQLADDPDTALVTGALLKATVAGGDVSGWTPEEQAAAVAAVAVIDSRLQDASDLVDGYLQSRYALPLAAVPKILEHYACDLARHLLYRGNAPDHITERQAAVMKALEKINSGAVNLGLAISNEPSPRSGGPESSSPGRVFTRDTLKDY
jgi:phage gp36-like protein